MKNISNPLRMRIDPDKGYLGKDGWFFLGNRYDRESDQALGNHAIDDAVSARWDQSLRYAAKVLERRSSKLIVFITPAKWSIYPDKVDRRKSAAHPSSPFHRLRENLTGSEVTFVDATAALIEARKIADTFSPLNSHWNNFGGLVGWNELRNAIIQCCPEISLPEVPRYECIETVDDFNEAFNMVGLEGRNPWMRPVYAEDLPTYDYLLPGYVRSVQRGEREIDLTELPVITECSSTPNRARALLLRDSTGNQISPFIQTGFRRVLQQQHNYEQERSFTNVLGPVKLFNPDVVIFLMTERYLIYNFLDAEYWKDANDFDLAIAGETYIWPRELQRQSIEVFFGEKFESPEGLKLPNNDGRKRHANITLNCKTISSIQVKTASPGAGYARSFPVNAGINEIFFTLEADMVASEIILSAPIDYSITRIEIRCA
ncbi:hypothetical protein ACFFP0_30535 [Rhizobium puerariae]|uniref:AlgX/AlgJ SGNH hydrolase-like domain-containing protein n=1 Tax=Rhizobium puerariae TaxID=1585791 RepID=A0ABV6ARF3_9HYPH